MSAIFLFFGKFIGSAVFGSITGFIGSYLKGKQEISKLKVTNKFTLEKMSKQMEMQKLEIAGASQRAKISADAQKDVADAEAISNAHKQDKATYSKWKDAPKFVQYGLSMVDILRGTVRPVLSYYAAAGLSWMVYRFLTLIPLAVLLEQRPETFWAVYEYVLMGVAFTAFASITYWYGTRPMKAQSS